MKSGSCFFGEGGIERNVTERETTQSKSLAICQSPTARKVRTLGQSVISVQVSIIPPLKLESCSGYSLRFIFESGFCRFSIANSSGLWISLFKHTDTHTRTYVCKATRGAEAERCFHPGFESSLGNTMRRSL